MPLEAGKGSYRRFLIPGGEPLGEELKRDQDYVSVTAVAWFINKQGNWWADRMASGTLEIRLNNGKEKYEAALGAFALKDGSRFAPVFDNPVLTQRKYTGGDLVIRASLHGFRTDTVLAELLKSAADASLGIVAGMIDAATLAGPHAVLGGAGRALVGGVRGVLRGNEKHEQLFDLGGLTVGVSPGELESTETYLLMHRGSDLDEKDRMRIDENGAQKLPRYKGHELVDGAWLLLRISRSREYQYERPWAGAVRELRADLASLQQDLRIGSSTKAETLKAFKPGDGRSTVYDRFVSARSAIFTDAALTTSQARVLAAGLTNEVIEAKSAVEEWKPDKPDTRSPPTDLGFVDVAAGLAPTDLPGAVFQRIADDLQESDEGSFLRLAPKEAARAASSGLGPDVIRELAEKMPSSFDLSIVENARKHPMLEYYGVSED